MEELYKIYAFRKKTHAKAFMKCISSHHSIKVVSLTRDGKELHAYRSDIQYYRYIELAQAFNSGIKFSFDEICQQIMGECVNDIVKSSDKEITCMLTERDYPLDGPDSIVEDIID